MVSCGMILAIVEMLVCDDLARFPCEFATRQQVAYLESTRDQLACRSALWGLRSDCEDLEDCRRVLSRWELLQDAQRTARYSSVRALERLESLRHCLGARDYAAGKMPLPRWCEVDCPSK